MDRLTITVAEQALIDDYRATHGIQMTDVVIDGSNIVVDDHLQIDNTWKVVVLGGNTGLSVYALIPEWDDYIADIDLVDYITGRAGPNGETMPIWPPAAMAARAAKADAPNPKLAAREEKHDEHARRRGLHKALKDAIARLPHDQQKHAREVLRQHGALGKDD